jgi:geranylgeranyl diphosphate synthase type II
MDKALLRRNFETVHAKWDENVAILSGDAMLILAYQLISSVRPEVLSPLLNMFNRTALEVCEGQQYDMNFEFRKRVSVDEYLNMIRLKTAVLLAASLASGGIIAKADQGCIEALYQFGINIGMAFQLQDDYLDVFPASEKFGKTIGGDIVANKKTYLLLSAMQTDNNEIRKELMYWLSHEDFIATEKIEAVKSIYQALNLDKKTQDLSLKYFRQGLIYLDRIDAPSDGLSQLKEVVEFLIDRKY